MRPERGAPSGDGALRLRIVLRPDFLAVRRALAEVLAGLGDAGLSEEESGTLEIVLAEALNNVVAHAARARGIELRIARAARTLRCAVTDDGAPAGGTIGDFARPPDPGCPREDGFGCFLIAALAKDVRYTAHQGRNRLSFRLDVAGPALH